MITVPKMIFISAINPLMKDESSLFKHIKAHYNSSLFLQVCPGCQENQLSTHARWRNSRIFLWVIHVVRAEDNNKMTSLSRHEKHLEKHPLWNREMSDMSDVAEQVSSSHINQHILFSVTWFLIFPLLLCICNPTQNMSAGHVLSGIWTGVSVMGGGSTNKDTKDWSLWCQSLLHLLRSAEWSLPAALNSSPLLL